MANEKAAQSTDNLLERRAFELYAARRAQFGGRGNPELVAIECYRDAEAFLSASEKIKCGELTTTELLGADCCAPNLPKTHPVNMVSQKHWNPAAINRIAKILSEDHAKEIKSFEEFGWQESEVNSARTLFPAFVSAN